MHNGIVTNSAELRLVLQKRGYKFETETDTEAVAILTKYIYDSQSVNRMTFTDLVKAVLKELEGSFAFVFKSIHYPNEVVTARRGSPLLIGVKTDKKLKVDFVDVEFAGQDSNDSSRIDDRESPHSLRCIHNSLTLPQHSPKYLDACSSYHQSQGPSYSIPSFHVRGWSPSTYRVLYRV